MGNLERISITIMTEKKGGPVPVHRLEDDRVRVQHAEEGLVPTHVIGEGDVRDHIVALEKMSALNQKRSLK